MRIRTWLITALATAAVAAAIATAGAAWLDTQARLALDQRSAATAALFDLDGMLDWAADAAQEPSAAEIPAAWRDRNERLRDMAAAAARRPSAGTAAPVAELHRQTLAAGATFDLLTRAQRDGTIDPSGVADRKALIDRLHVQSRQMVLAGQRWAAASDAALRQAQGRLAALALAVPVLMLLALVATAAMVRRRVLRPLAALQAINGSDSGPAGAAGTPPVGGAADEVGDMARAMDTVAASLARRHAGVIASERRLRALVEHLPAAVAHVDAGQRYTFANAVLATLAGGTPADFPGRTVAQTWGPERHAAIAPHLERALAGETVSFEYERRIDGATRYLRSTYVPERDDAGEVSGFYELTSDVTAAHMARQRQDRVERQLRAIADNLPVLISYIDRDERYGFLNATFDEWMGIDPQQAVGKRMSDVIPTELYLQRREHVQRALAGERAVFAVESKTGGRLRNLETVYIPDVQDGVVMGIYTLTTDVTALKRAERQLVHLARADQLTGLPNRRKLDERLGEAVGRTLRSGKALGLLYVDIDHFKAINDEHGHAVGDAVLREFANRLQACIRETDLAARASGDEFAVLLEGLQSEADAALAARKILDAMRAPFRVGGQHIDVTASIGVAYAARPRQAESLMACADAALFEAKDDGRDTFRVLVPSAVTA